MTDLKKLYEVCANLLYREACIQVVLRKSEDYDGRWISTIKSIIDLHPDEDVQCDLKNLFDYDVRDFDEFIQYGERFDKVYNEHKNDIATVRLLKVINSYIAGDCVEVF